MTRKVSYKLKPWLTESGLLRIQGWARDGLMDLANYCLMTVMCIDNNE